MSDLWRNYITKILIYLGSMEASSIFCWKPCFGTAPGRTAAGNSFSSPTISGLVTAGAVLKKVFEKKAFKF